jgi:adenylyltransferase/sulfurtransferase
MNYITVTELKECLTNADTHIVLDICEPYELEICNIGGIMIPMGEVPARATELNNGKTIAVLCKTGRRAEAVANFLQSEHGVENVVVVEGGITAWIEQIDNTLESY